MAYHAKVNTKYYRTRTPVRVRNCHKVKSYKSQRVKLKIQSFSLVQSSNSKDKRYKNFQNPRQKVMSIVVIDF